MTDWLNASDKEFFKSRLENPLFIAQLKETEGLLLVFLSFRFIHGPNPLPRN